MSIPLGTHRKINILLIQSLDKKILAWKYLIMKMVQTEKQTVYPKSKYNVVDKLI